jgi:ArsR family transcriptional regulator
MHIAMKAAHLDVAPVTQLFKALGDDSRLRVVALLTHGELCVCHIQEALELSQPNVSRQLGLLRAAGVVDHRRDGNWVYYRLADQENADRKRLLKAVVAGFAGQDVLRRDVEKLLKVRGPNSCR